MSTEQKYKGVKIKVSAPFKDKIDNKESIVVRFFLEKTGSDELCFCDIQFPQEIKINVHRMTDDETEAMLIYYDQYEADIWKEARISEEELGKTEEK